MCKFNNYCKTKIKVAIMVLKETSVKAKSQYVSLITFILIWIQLKIRTVAGYGTYRRVFDSSRSLPIYCRNPGEGVLSKSLLRHVVMISPQGFVGFFEP